jgi:hypothetical protein
MSKYYAKHFTFPETISLALHRQAPDRNRPDAMGRNA